ncbi:polyribonucleotide nucleotidyltransferase [Candidatus Parcubacteria bacterium]|nr:MAG: polyribonucleotide nucleotidyltransferase [Candidatus Parcubacteria bacterium]
MSGRTDRKQFSIDVGGKTLSLEISSLAGQTNAAVLAKYGESVVLTTVVMSKRDSEANYMPLKVDYEERFYAAGKIIGSRFIRREGRPSEDAILAGRLVDRTLRPLFDQRIRREIQVVVTVLAIDEENDPDFIGLVGASTALAISDVPWAGPAAGVRIGKIGGKLSVNPNNSDLKSAGCAFEAFVSGAGGAVNMIELQGSEAGEGEVLEAIGLAQEEISRLAELQEKIVKEVGKPKAKLSLFEPDPGLRAAIEKFLSGKLEDAVYQGDKAEYHNRLTTLREALLAYLAEQFEKTDFKAADAVFEEAVDRLVHKNVIEADRRPDGRKLDQIRELGGEVGLFSRTHGSALFTRGNTQALAVTTLAAPGAEQLIETMETTGKRRFMLHYNFPPYSVGEIGTFRGPGRREVGHGALAEKSLRPLIPPQEEFPYTIRVVSEILSSNGSSSMATVCAATLSLMDAGVPLKRPAAGIAMGLMMEDERQYKILTDIQGPEDHHGDMDLKIAGTEVGVTGIQMDVKVRGLTMEILEKVFAQAKKARLEILGVMKAVIDKPRSEPSPYAPAIFQTRINPEKIGLLIGPGGKMINGLIRKYGLASIDVEEDGSVFVAGSDREKAEAALSEIKSLTREYKIGDIVEGEVIKTLDFGAIVDLGGGQDGMIHVSELKNGFVKTVSEVVKVGDFVRAKVIRADADGRIGLSIKQLQ